MFEPLKYSISLNRRVYDTLPTPVGVGFHFETVEKVLNGLDYADY